MGLDAAQPGLKDAPDEVLVLLLELVGEVHLVVAELPDGHHQRSQLLGQRTATPRLGGICTVQWAIRRIEAVGFGQNVQRS